MGDNARASSRSRTIWSWCRDYFATGWTCLKPQWGSSNGHHVDPVAEPEDRPEYGSAELLLTVALDERQHRIAAHDAMQAKIGVLLGLASVLVVLAGDWVNHRERFASASPALVAAVLCVRNLITSKVGATETTTTRNTYLTEPAAYTAWRVLDSLLVSEPLLARALTCAKWTLNTSACLLIACTFINFALLMVEP